jgi:triosephosphate isomerase (TIM)
MQGDVSSTLGSAHRVRWVIGNWKMNGSLAANAALLEAVVAHHRSGSAEKKLPVKRVGVCVPAPYFNQAQRLLGASVGSLSSQEVALGAQDVSEHASGAYTGQISASMLREFAVSHVLVGHSERRQYNLESDELVAAKATAAFLAGITPVICVGETLEEREAGSAEFAVAAQLAPCGPLIREAGAALVFAYEPVWAIGTGKTASPAEAQALHRFIRDEIARYSPDARDTSILYGGSVKPSNARELFGQPDIDGGLIGGASLVAADFNAIVNAL